MISDRERRHRALTSASWQRMEIAGERLDGVEWAALAGTAGWVGYWMRMAPGSRSLPHRHSALELLVVLQGEVQDSDGQCFGEGSSLVYAAGSEHWLSSPKGCVLLVVETGPASLAATPGTV